MKNGLLVMVALVLVAPVAGPAWAQEDEREHWVCVPTEERGWLCGRGEQAPEQAALPAPPPASPPPPGYTAPPEAARLPPYLQMPEADAPEAGARPEESEAAAPAAEEPAGEPERIEAPGRVTPESATGPVYAIQLAAARDPERLDRFAAGHDLEHLALERRRWRDEGGTWHVLVSGRYASASAARAALAELPAEMRAAGAWVRRVDNLDDPQSEGE